jgi:hypothetical protein
MLPRDTSSGYSVSESVTPAPAKGAFIIVFNSKQDAGGTKTVKKPRVRHGQLAFINTTGCEKHTPDARQRIRTQVMSDYWQKHMAAKRRSHDASGDLPDPVRFSSYPPTILARRLGGPDPFSSLPIKMRPFMYPVLKNCKLPLQKPIPTKRVGKRSSRCSYGSHHA